MKFCYSMFFNKFILRAIALIVFILSIAFQVSAQVTTSSPYSRYGLGDQLFHGMAHQWALGGSGIASDSGFHSNLLNPASYSSLQLTTVEAGMFSNTTQFNTGQQSITSTNASLHYVSFGFPIKRWWGLTFGVLPYSTVGYSITDTIPAPVGEADVLYSGSGGINKIFLGNGISFLNDSVSRLKGRRLSLGFNVNYYYGSSFQKTVVNYPDISGSLSARNEKVTTISDYSFDYGLQYKFSSLRIKGKRLTVALGLVAELGKDMRARTDELTRTFLVKGVVETVKDTVSNASNRNAIITLPSTYGGGLSISYNNKLTILADYKIQGWSDFRFDGRNDSLNDGSRMSIGIDYIPDNTASGFFKQTHYRLGGYIINGPIRINGNVVSEKAVTMGFGFPLKKTRSTVNLGVALGTRGSTTDLVEERFIKASVGFTMNDRWFIRRKFD